MSLLPKNEQKPLLLSRFPPVSAVGRRVGPFQAALETVLPAHTVGFAMTLIIDLVWNKLTEALCAEDGGFLSKPIASLRCSQG